MSTSPDDALAQMLRRRVAQLSRSSLLPIAFSSPTTRTGRGWLAPQGSSESCTGEVIGLGDQTSCAFTLTSIGDNSLRLTLTGTRNYEPLSLLVGPSLHAAVGEAAVGEIVYPQVETRDIARAESALAAHSEPVEHSLAADDQPPLGTTSLPPSSTRFHAASDEASWSYDTHDPDDCLEIAVRVGEGEADVWAEVRFESLDQPARVVTRYVRLSGPRASDRWARANLFHASPHLCGNRVRVRVSPVRTRDPRGAEIVLSEKSFQAFPLTPAGDSSWIVTGLRDEQAEALVNPANDWALRITDGTEGRS